MSSDGGQLRIVIAGSSLAAAAAAAALSKSLPSDRFRIDLVDAPADDPDELAPVQPLLPSAIEFHAQLGLDEGALVEAAGASFALGTAYSGWRKDGESSFSPLGDIGVPLHGLPFHLVALHARKSGASGRLCDFSIATILAQASAFQRPSPDPRSPLSTFEYGLHVERTAYADALLDVAIRHGARRAGAVERVKSAGGRIETVVLDDGTAINPGLVIDATGPRRLVIGALDPRLESWSERFGFDRIGARAFPAAAPPVPFAHVAAIAAGWRAAIPARSFLAELVAFDSARTSDEAVADMVAAAPYGRASRQMSFTPAAAGRLRESWIGNCLALGSASCLVEPGSGLSMHLVQSCVGRFLTLFSGAQANHSERSEFNRLAADEADRAADFALARYALNGRLGEPFWDERRDAPLSPELRHKIDSYRERARVPLADGDEQDEPDWAALLDSLGIAPVQLGAAVSAIDPADAARTLGRMRQALLAAAATVPGHAQFLAAALDGSAA